MSRVICNHSRRTLDSAGAACEAQAPLHDKHNFADDAAAVAFLLDLIAPDLAGIISKKLEEMDSFHVAWLELMNEIQVQTVERIEIIKCDIKNRRPQQHPGQVASRTWRKLPSLFVVKPWNFKMPDSASTT